MESAALNCIRKLLKENANLSEGGAYCNVHLNISDFITEVTIMSPFRVKTFQ